MLPALSCTSSRGRSFSFSAHQCVVLYLFAFVLMMNVTIYELFWLLVFLQEYLINDAVRYIRLISWRCRYRISIGDPEPGASVLDRKVARPLSCLRVLNTPHSACQKPQKPSSDSKKKKKSIKHCHQIEVVCIQWKSINCHLVQLKTILHRTGGKVVYSFTFIWH